MWIVFGVNWRACARRVFSYKYMSLENWFFQNSSLGRFFFFFRNSVVRENRISSRAADRALKLNRSVSSVCRRIRIRRHSNPIIRIHYYYSRTTHDNFAGYHSGRLKSM